MSSRTLNSLVAEFERTVGIEMKLAGAKTFDDLVGAFERDFSPVVQLVERLNGILRGRGDPNASLELEWVRKRDEARLEGCLVARRSGRAQGELPVDYEAGRVTVGGEAGEDRPIRSADATAVGVAVCAFASRYFR